MEHKISIIIPAYNIEGYIEPCLNSILKQTFHDFEVIVVDDGSTDGTPGILDSYGDRDPRIKVIHKKNEGVSKARNTGIELATGTYYLFFDGDDFVEPYTCQELYDLIQKKEADALIYGYHRYENQKVKDTWFPIFKEGFYEGEAIFSELIPRFIGLSSESINNWIHHVPNSLYVENPALWRTMLKASVVKENHLRFREDLKVGEDTIFISEYLSHAKKCFVYHKCYYYLVIRESSTIYQYEKNPFAKLEGKRNLLQARRDLTNEIQSRCGRNMSQTWSGTVLMSAIEIAFLMSRKHPEYGFWKRFGAYKSYVKEPTVRSIIKESKIKLAANIMVIPFLLLKWHLNLLLFLAAWVLQLMHFEFQRN